MTHPTVIQALAAVAGDVRAVRKDDVNSHQRFNFRGIDAVLNAVGPAFRTHGVVCLPITEDVALDTVMTTGGKPSTRALVKVRYRFHGPAGDYVEAVVTGESWDTGDKATAKAFSVAYRTALLQTLTIPTDEPDPDHSTFEQTSTAQPVQRGQRPFKKVAPKPPAAADVAMATDAEVEVLRARLADLSPDDLARYGEWRHEAGVPLMKPGAVTYNDLDAVAQWLDTVLPSIPET